MEERQEDWRPVPGFEGLYSVSDGGRVLSHERTCPTYNGQRRVRQRLLKAGARVQAGEKKPRIVKLSKQPDGEDLYATVAALVLTVFVRPARDGEVAHYKNGDHSDASLANVEWSTYSRIAVEVGYSPPRNTRGAQQTRERLGR